MASGGNHTAASGVSLPSPGVGRAEGFCSAAPSHRSQSYRGPRPASRAWSRRWAPLGGGRAGPGEAAGSGRSRNTTPRRASAAPRTSSGPGRYLGGSDFMITHITCVLGYLRFQNVSRILIHCTSITQNTKLKYQCTTISDTRIHYILARTHIKGLILIEHFEKGHTVYTI